MRLEQKIPITKSFTLSVSLKRIRSFLTPVGYVIVALVFFQIFTAQIVLGNYESPILQNVVRASTAQQGKVSAVSVPITSGNPVRLKISKIRVNAVIDSVGLLKDGSMGVPKTPSKTAWYMLGPKPGENGSAVIAGHVNWWYGATGVFKNLKMLKAGDVVTVQNDQGKNISFVVREIRSFGQADDASDVFTSSDGKSHLNLVTCSGVWNKLTQQYSKRLVVFTDKVAEVQSANYGK